MRSNFYRKQLWVPTYLNYVDLSKYAIGLFCLQHVWNSPFKIIFTNELQTPKGTNTITYSISLIRYQLFSFVEQVPCMNLFCVSLGVTQWSKQRPLPSRCLSSDNGPICLMSSALRSQTKHTRTHAHWIGHGGNSGSYWYWHLYVKLSIHLYRWIKKRFFYSFVLKFQMLFNFSHGFVYS